MNIVLIFIWIYAAMIANSFWEAYIEGDNAWAKGKLGRKVKIIGLTISSYHFWLYVVMHPLLVTLPLVVFGFSWELFGVLMSAYISGLIIQDFFWYVVNPGVPIANFNSKYACWYPWLKFGRFEIPALYVMGVLGSLFFWVFFWSGL